MDKGAVLSLYGWPTHLFDARPSGGPMKFRRALVPHMDLPTVKNCLHKCHLPTVPHYLHHQHARTARVALTS
jgi:hypothetical protein